MIARWTTAVLLILVPMMIALGGIVHATGSSLACPDWPLCYGEAMPEMTGGIFYEHGHRLLGALIGVAMIVLSVGLYRLERTRIAKTPLYIAALVTVGLQLIVFGAAVSGGELGSLWLECGLVAVFGLCIWGLQRRGMALTNLGLLGLELVVLQGLLGGLTVVFRLPPLVSTLHLTVAMMLLAGLAFLWIRLDPRARRGPSLISRRFLALTLVTLFVQIVLGAFMRHSGASFACGVDLFSCQGGIVGEGGAAHTAFAHRWFAMVVAALTIGSTVPLLRTQRQSRRHGVRFLAISAHGLVIAQIVLGFLTLNSYIPLGLVTLHQGVASLLILDLVALFIFAGPWGGRYDELHQRHGVSEDAFGAMETA